ncbi:2,5-diketo-D-gluconic acid reductase [Burkholderia mallei]|uniref:2,5-diketo-D-gluconic acid reductase n=2 Tax=pseudomallei group TaxID=111527 RepID=A0AAX1X785_BURML|nr:2,5-diketo-D-gluconic acid reductase [Burkholderia pseudomallei]EXI99530.1 2,5-diketo-D-gluconic acid reductase [Burkholderia pseudomallei MSHR6137]PNX03200.1 2,5-diketo-D-gluconic acid reductase [Burkholderia sp. 136(2017)]PNX14438.1 2,5-diketo-D-gluconic acid reductase [Burkholderia sp. 129]PNX29950.1 2,5-diketo-D-gluconic acid reductase [Burkholderia sp. 117]PNX38755.1 2,5-diketo-D-gluconic acid reductase [Burkholderia sp. 137]RKN92568.1 2,5-diketo-D-gluconic acid reductase [Burkholderi
MDVFRFCWATRVAAGCFRRKNRAASGFSPLSGAGVARRRSSVRIAIKTPKGRGAPWCVRRIARVRCASASPRT